VRRSNPRAGRKHFKQRQRLRDGLSAHRAAADIAIPFLAMDAPAITGGGGEMDQSHRLLRTAAYARSYRCFDAFIDLVTPPLVNLLMAVSAMFMISVILLGLGYWELGPVIWLWAGLMGLGMVHLLVGIQAARGSVEDLKVLLHLPRYALWKLLLYAGMIKKRVPNEWIRTHREVLVPVVREQNRAA